MHIKRVSTRQQERMAQRKQRKEPVMPSSLSDLYGNMTPTVKLMVKLMLLWGVVMLAMLVIKGQGSRGT